MKKTDFDKSLYWSEEIWGETRCWHWFTPDMDEHRQRISVNGRRLLVHRLAYDVLRQRGKELAGPLKKNQPLVRICDDPRCISPYHHMPALSQKAIAESGKWTGIRPNDPRGAHNRAKERCRHGHSFTAENTEWTKDGKRLCKACKQERAWLPLDQRHIVHGNRHRYHVIGRTPAEFADEDNVEGECTEDEWEAYWEEQERLASTPVGADDFEVPELRSAS